MRSPSKLSEASLVSGTLQYTSDQLTSASSTADEWAMLSEWPFDPVALRTMPLQRLSFKTTRNHKADPRVEDIHDARVSMARINIIRLRIAPNRTKCL